MGSPADWADPDKGISVLIVVMIVLAFLLFIIEMLAVDFSVVSDAFGVGRVTEAIEGEVSGLDAGIGAEAGAISESTVLEVAEAAETVEALELALEEFTFAIEASGNALVETIGIALNLTGAMQNYSAAVQGANDDARTTAQDLITILLAAVPLIPTEE